MLSQRIYYILKPYLPWSFRIALRRIAAKRQRRNTTTWPIDPSAARPPPNWRGWPNGKRFAVVLTHDVEGASGLARCQPLAALEARMGFRSSFNFIPEGTYSVPSRLRAELMSDGFEVGVHDLRHDGRLYANRASFRQQAARINEYLREWNAVGFRSGFMYHNQEWLHDLNVEYDASTFDTDPFEPQPDGVNTIFPFWVPARETRADKIGGQVGYAELPYTLPQDSTLYLLLQEPNASIWFSKVDWIARHGGMVLVNVHPDYLAYNPRRGPASCSGQENYEQLLRYIRDRFPGEYWHALPREVAAFVRREQHPQLTASVR